MRLRLVALAVLLALGAQPLAHAVEGSRQYTVKPGDTLGAIGQSLGVPVNRLVEANGLTDANQIVAGRTLVVPDLEGALVQSQVATSLSSTSPSTPPSDEYVVKAGDTLSGIAARFGITVATLAQSNQTANPDRLVVGQKLVVPSRAGVQTVTETRTTPAVPGGGQVETLLSDAAARHRLEPALVKSLAWYLSGWKTGVSSPTGPVGVMQITAATQEWVGQSLLKRAVDRADAADNVEIGVAYLAYLVQKLGDERQGVAAYLQGPGSVSRSGISTSTSKSLDAIYGARPRFGGSASTPTTASQSLTTVPTRDLQSAVLAASRSVGADARVGIAARNLTTGEQVNIRSAELFPSASVNKLAIMVEAFRQFSTGKLVRTSSISHDLERMILLSDNDAANRLLDKLGEKEINAGMVSLGLPSTQMRNYFSLSRGPRDPGFNQTTPSDTASLLTLIATDRAVNPASSQEMRALLHRAHDATKLVGGLPPGTKVAHKSGWYAGVANDAGIVYPNGRGAYILAVFSEGSFSAELGNQLVAAVSKAIYQAWGR